MTVKEYSKAHELECKQKGIANHLKENVNNFDKIVDTISKDDAIKQYGTIYNVPINLKII